MPLLGPSGAIGFFEDRGWSRTQAAGIVGNLYFESGGWNPAAIGDSGSAFGLAQWRGSRQSDFQRIIGRPIQGSTVEQQLAFVDWELRNTEARAGRILQGQTTVAGATQAFAQYYERPANLSSVPSRTRAAISALEGVIGRTANNILNSTLDAAEGIPVVGDIIGGVRGVTDGLGLTGECSWLCQLQTWIRDSGFFQRVALAIFAFIILFAAFYMMKGGNINQFTARLARS